MQLILKLPLGASCWPLGVFLVALCGSWAPPKCLPDVPCMSPKCLLDVCWVPPGPALPFCFNPCCPLSRPPSLLFFPCHSSLLHPQLLLPLFSCFFSFSSFSSCSKVRRLSDHTFQPTCTRAHVLIYIYICVYALTCLHEHEQCGQATTTLTHRMTTTERIRCLRIATRNPQNPTANPITPRRCVLTK